MECPHFGMPTFRNAHILNNIVFPLPRIHPSDLLTFYKACVRPVMEYARPVFHGSLPSFLKRRVRDVTETSFHIIYPSQSYAEALAKADIARRFDRRQHLTTTSFTYIVNDESQKLYDRARTLHSVTAT